MTATARPGEGTAPATAGPTTSQPDHRFALTLSLRDDYVQLADFAIDGVPSLVLDEPPPLGHDEGPNPARVLGAAIGACLGASLLFCLRKSRVGVTDLRTTVEGTMVRNEAGRLRIEQIRVHLTPSIVEADLPRISRCLQVFEDYCIVTQSVRDGLDVAVEVTPTAVAAATD